MDNRSRNVCLSHSSRRYTPVQKCYSCYISSLWLQVRCPEPRGVREFVKLWKDACLPVDLIRIWSDDLDIGSSFKMSSTLTNCHLTFLVSSLSFRLYFPCRALAPSLLFLHVLSSGTAGHDKYAALISRMCSPRGKFCYVRCLSKFYGTPRK